MENPPPSIPQLVKRHNLACSPLSLIRAEKELVKELAAARKDYQVRQKDLLRKTLRKALSYLRKSDPKLARRIAERCIRYKSEEHRKRRRALDEKALILAKELNDAGIPPRYDCIIPMPGNNSLSKWDDVSKAIQRARMELGLAPDKTGLKSRTAHKK